MKELTDWWKEFNGSDRRWLVLGKGPSFGRRDQYDLTPYTTFGINHVVRDMKVDVASAVNYEVIEHCGEAHYTNCGYLIMPRHPHDLPGNAPQPLENYFERFPVLKRMDDEGRLVWFNCAGDTPVPGSPIIGNGWFSIVILLNMLGELGVREVHALGIDGGSGYAPSFTDLFNRTHLTNGAPSYSHQFKDMARAIKKYHMRYTPLNDRDLRLRALLAWHLLRQTIRIDPFRKQRMRRLAAGG